MSELISMSPLNSDTSALLLSQIAKYSSHIKWGFFWFWGFLFLVFGNRVLSLFTLASCSSLSTSENSIHIKTPKIDRVHMLFPNKTRGLQAIKIYGEILLPE